MIVVLWILGGLILACLLIGIGASLNARASVPTSPAAPVATGQTAVPTSTHPIPILPASVRPGAIQVNVLPDGVEQFTSPLLCGRVYKMTVTGVYYHQSWTEEAAADAAYQQDHPHGSFTVPYSGLEFKGFAGRYLDPWEEDRHLHEYVRLIEGTGQRLAISLKPPKYCVGRRGQLQVYLEIQPIGTMTIFGRDEATAKAKKLAEEKAKNAAEQQEKQRLQQEALTYRKETIQRRVSELAIRVDQERNFLDLAFCQQFVIKNQQQVLGQLGALWKQEHQKLVVDQELTAAVRQQAPEVLTWFQQRVDMVVLAERLDTVPLATPASLQTVVPITDRTIANVENSVANLFALRDDYDKKQHALVRGARGSQQELQQVLRSMAFHYDLLRRYGISATTPEDAEKQFRILCPCEPIKTIYERLEERIVAGEKIGVDVMTERVKDLFAEQCILVAQRKHAMRKQDWDEQRGLDKRIENARAELARWMDFLRGQGHDVSLRPVEQEQTLEQGIVGLIQQKVKVKEQLVQLGETEAAEAIEALYAEQAAKLFKSTEAYT